MRKAEQLEQIRTLLQNENQRIKQELTNVQNDKSNNYLTDYADKNQLADQISNQQMTITQLSHEVQELTETNNKFHQVL